MIAAFPMYPAPDNREAHDRLWVAIRDRLRARGVSAPDALDHEVSHIDGWARPDLVLSMICNLPYRARFRGKVTRIGAADYGLPDTAPGYYRSVFVVRADDPAQRLEQAAPYPLAFNEPLSYSGWGAAQDHAQALGLALNPALRTGAHRESLRAVAEGRAGLAALDAITWINLQRCDPAARAVRVIGQTHASPGMTFITAAGRDPAPYFDAIAGAISEMSEPDRNLLGLRGIITLPDAAYDTPLPPFPAGFAPCTSLLPLCVAPAAPSATNDIAMGQESRPIRCKQGNPYRDNRNTGHDD